MPSLKKQKEQFEFGATCSLASPVGLATRKVRWRQLVTSWNGSLGSISCFLETSGFLRAWHLDLRF